MLVVIGIIVLIIGFALPMTLKAWRQGDRARTAADLNTIGIALDAFKNDFGEYPRVETPGTGFAVLGKSLVGPLDSTTSTFTNPSIAVGTPAKAGTVYYTGAWNPNAPPNFGVVQYVALLDTENPPPGVGTWSDSTNGGPTFTDGADGPGFRIRTGGAIKQPYLQPGKFKMQGLALLDHNGNPILYFPKSPVAVNINIRNGANPGHYVSARTNPPVQGAINAPTMFNFDDNVYLATATSSDPTSANRALAKMQAILGMRDPGSLASGSAANGILASSESAATEAPYLLWSAGPDQLFGPVDDVLDASGTAKDRFTIDRLVQKCDDVTNFR